MTTEQWEAFVEEHVAQVCTMIFTVCYCGAAIPEGGHVKTEQWEAFVGEYAAQEHIAMICPLPSLIANFRGPILVCCM